MLDIQASSRFFMASSPAKNSLRKHIVNVADFQVLPRSLQSTSGPEVPQDNETTERLCPLNCETTKAAVSLNYP
jgi:hypothetical protein